MSKTRKLAIDLMGTDKGPESAIKACLDFLQKHDDVELVVIGSQEWLSKIDHSRIQKVACADYFEQADSIFAIRKKTNTSMQTGMEMLQKKTVNGFLSAGNTSIFVTLAYSTLGMLPNIKKPGFMPFFPTVKKGVYFNMLDVGANLECSASDLVNYAYMANQFQKSVLNISEPKIAILNIGTEKTKGYDYHQQAYETLKADASLNFLGFIEPRNLLKGEVDIVLTDGYAGNMVLKAMEGTMLALSGVLKQNYKKPKNFLALLFSINIIKQLKKTFDYKNQAGAIVLGVDGLLVKTHGSAGYLEFSSALSLMYDAAKKNVIQGMKLCQTNSKNS